jgi:hypothetical protein
VLLIVAALWAAPHAQGPSTVAARVRLGPSQAVAPAAAAGAEQKVASARGAGATLPNAAAVTQVVKVPAAARPGHHQAAPPAPRPAPAPAPPAPPRGGGFGFDISWPQCDGAYPGVHNVGTVGITDGRPFSTNPCVQAEWGWAKASNFPGGAQAYWNLELDGTSTGPHHCGADDHACRAYDYGQVTAMDTIARATSLGVRPDFWWLDVEIGNNWSDVHLDWNARTVQGAIDYFNARGLPVGIYSSYDQWSMIVPDGYRPNVPVWRAVVGDPGMAPSMCAQSHSFTSGPVLMVQYDDHMFDQDYICTAGTLAFGAAAARPH